MATGIEARLNDWLIPAALGAVLYFLQALAHDSQESTRNIAILITRMDSYDNRLTHVEKEPCTRP